MGDEHVSWLASIEVRSDGTWYTVSAVRHSRKEAWDWLQSRLMWCDVVQIPRKGAKVCRMPKHQRHDPGQFDFLQGNEACASEWQN